MSESLTPELRSLKKNADSSDVPVLRRWAGLSGAVYLAGEEFPDEEDVLKALTADFSDSVLNSLFFFGEPVPIVNLRKRHARTMRDPAAHILNVSRTQYAELLMLIASENELISRRQSLDRGQARRKKELADVLKTMDELDTQLGFVLLRPILSKELLPFLPELKFKDAAAFRKVAQLQMRNYDRIIREVGPIFEELKALDMKLETIALCKSKLDRLKARIDASKPEVPAAAVELESQTTVQPQIKPALQKPSIPRPRRSSSDRDGCQPAVPSVPETLNAQQLSLMRVREAVELGNRVGKLRLMIPEEGEARRRHERGWTTLLRELGFHGELIVAPTYESLKSGEAPILMPRDMHTHTGRWKANVSAPLFVIDFAFPNFLLRLHQAGEL